MTLWHHEAKRLFNIDRCMTARVTDLFVMEVPANFPFEIREIDRQERVYDVSRRREILLPMAVPEPVAVHDLVGHEGDSRSATPTTVEKKLVHDGFVTAAVDRMGTPPVEKKVVHENGSVVAPAERSGTPVVEREKAVGSSVSRETHVPVSAGRLARALK